MKLFLDDERDTPAGWVRAYWPDEVISLLETGLVAELSLDHDLGDDERGTGYDVILWIEEAVALRDFVSPKISVHSANSSAVERMRAGIGAIEKLGRERAAQQRLADGKMIIKLEKVRPFRGFTHTPEEGQELSRTSFTDTPLLKRKNP